MFVPQFAPSSNRSLPSRADRGRLPSDRASDRALTKASDRPLTKGSSISQRLAELRTAESRTVELRTAESVAPFSNLGQPPLEGARPEGDPWQGGNTTHGGGVFHPLVSWIELEVVSRLLRLDKKLDHLAFMMDGGAASSVDMGNPPSPARSFRQSSKKVWPNTPQMDGSPSSALSLVDVWNGAVFTNREEASLPLPMGDAVAEQPVWEPFDASGEGRRSTDGQPPAASPLQAPNSNGEVMGPNCAGPDPQDAMPSQMLSCSGKAAGPSPQISDDSTWPGPSSKDQSPTGEIDNLDRQTSKGSKGSKESDLNAHSSTQSAETETAARRPSIISLAEIDSTFAHVARVSPWSERIWTTLEDPESSQFARYYASFMPCFILTSVWITLLQTMQPSPIVGMPAAVVETTIETCFLLELLLRLAVCPNRWTFWHNLHNIIDIVAVLPLILRFSIGFVIPEDGLDKPFFEGSAMGAACSILLCVVPVIRLLKTLRRFERFRLLSCAFELCFEALPICLFSLLVLTLVFASMIFMVEPRDNINSLPKAMWLTIVTMTTVGYGDVTPKSSAGSLVVAVLVISSVLYMAMPLGIIGQAFTQVWSDRDRILLMRRTKDRLLQWGYKATDIPVLFRSFDADGNGELDMSEFLDMMKEMRLGLKDERVIELFQSFDSDCSGSVDDREFVKSLFPAEYTKIYFSATDADGLEVPGQEAEPPQLKDAGETPPGTHLPEDCDGARKSSKLRVDPQEGVRKSSKSSNPSSLEVLVSTM